MKHVNHPDIDQMHLTNVMSALSDPIRVGIVRLLADGQERAWGDLKVPVGKSTLSHHLKVLRIAGLTRTREAGTRCFVQLRSADVDERFPGLLPAVLTAAGREDVGAQVELAEQRPESDRQCPISSRISRKTR